MIYQVRPGENGEPEVGKFASTQETSASAKGLLYIERLRKLKLNKGGSPTSFRRAASTLQE